MAVLNVQRIPADGATLTLAAADAAGDEAAVGEGTYVHLRNANATTAATVTFLLPVAVGGAVSVQRSIPAGGGQVVVPLSVRNQHPHSGLPVQRSSNRRATWTYSAAADITVAVLQAP